MKIIKFGRWRTIDMDDKISFHSYVCMSQSPYVGITNYHQERRNGGEEDGPITAYPIDGKFTWIKGRVAPEEVWPYRGSNGEISYGYYIYGEDKKDGTYEYELYYEEGPEDRKFFLQIDQRYLSRIEREGKLELLEPVIWYLRQNRTDNIRDWWAEMFAKPDLPEILEKAEQEYIHIKERYPVVILLDTAIKAANIDGTINVKKIIDQYHIDLSSDFLVVIYSIMKVSRYIKILDFSDIDLRENYTYLVKLFEKRNDFRCIDLHNTGIDDKALTSLLKALDLNWKTRGIPFTEEINLSDNNITLISELMDYLEKWITRYIDIQQQYGSGVTRLSNFNLRIINLENNLIKAEKEGGAEELWLVNYERILNELSQACNLRFKIVLTGNTISACVFNSPVVIELNAGDRLKFFGSARLGQKKSLICEDENLTLDMGIIYLACKRDEYPGHLSIYTELLNSIGQIEIMRLELCSKNLSSESKDDCVSPSKGGTIISFGDAKRLKASVDDRTINMRGYRIKVNLILQLIQNVQREHDHDIIRYSIDGVLGHNCSTWVFEKLKEINLHLPPTKIPCRAVSTTSGGILIKGGDEFSIPITNAQQSYCLVM